MLQKNLELLAHQYLIKVYSMALCKEKNSMSKFIILTISFVEPVLCVKVPSTK